MNKAYKEWIEYSKIHNTAMCEELMEISTDDNEITERFHKYLEFGTGGLRGVIGAGTNRMNVYTVRKVSQALSQYLKMKHQLSYKIAIAYDSRNFSELFAKEAAKVFSANNIEVYLFDSLRPTPQLSFAIKHLGCDGGIVITASHNPSKYNGYKVYASDGGQITLETAKQIYEFMSLTNEFEVKVDDLFSHVNMIGKDVDEAYYAQILELCKPYTLNVDTSLNVIYTPLHGSGYVPVTEMLKRLGFSNVSIIEEQRLPDGNFPTIKSPNPEERDSFDLALKLAKLNNADLVFATDPDCDRIGVAVKNEDNEYQLLTGNQIGALLINFLIQAKQFITPRDAVVKTIVTSELGALIASSQGATVFDTLTGFKYIGEKINEFETTHEYDFLFGYEESYGYLAGNFVRDKDAVIASSLIALMSAYYKNKGQSMISVLNSLYEKHGYFKDVLLSYTFEGISGKQKIIGSVEKFRNHELLESYFPTLEVIEDYKVSESYNLKNSTNEKILLPSENVIKLKFEDQSWIAIRPSGTEPKLKVYFSALGNSLALSENRFAELEKIVRNILEID